MGILLAIFSAFLWSLFDVVRKKAVENNSALQVIFIIILSQFFFFSCFLVISNLQINLRAYFLIGACLVILNVLSLYLFLLVLKSGKISIYIPMLSFTPFFSAIYSKLILNEELVFIQYIGMLFIVVGSLTLHSSQFNSQTKLSINYNYLNNKNLLYILIVSLIWSLTPVLDKECLKYTGVYLHGFLQSCGMLLLFPLILLNSNKYKSILMKKMDYDLIFFLIIILGFLTAFIQLMALQYVFVAELESLKRGIGIVLSLVFGYFIFKEEVNLKKIFSVLIIICGVNFIINFTKFTNLQIIM